MKSILKISILIMVLAISRMYSDEYYILKDKNTVLYQKPNIIAKKLNYKFNNGELLTVISNNGKDWIYLKLINKKKGWIRKNSALNIGEEANSKYYQEMINREIINPYAKFDPDQIFIELKLFNYTNQGYLGLQFRMPMEQWLNRTIFYQISNNNIYRVIDYGHYNTTLFFLNWYIILIDEIGLVVYSKNEYKEDSEKDINPGGKLYKSSDNMLLLPKGQYKRYDSHFEFDETNLILKKYVREKLYKPFIITEYKFTNGEFIQLKRPNEGTTN